MRGGTYGRCLALGLLQALIWLPSICAQSNQDDGCPAVSLASPQAATIVIDSMEFKGDAALTPKSLVRWRDELKRRSFHASSAADTDWRDQVGEEVRTLIQDEGYFQVLVDVAAGLIRAEPDRLHYWLTVRVDSGPQYRLGEVRFENGAELADRTLRPQFPLRKGELFNVSSIREGLSRITRLYGSRGYIDATIEPQFDIDSEAHQINITFKFDPGVQYRIGAVQIRGWSVEVEKLLRSKFASDQVFDSTALSEFFAENKTLLPGDATLERNVTLVRDAHNGRVGIDFERVACQTP
jgi:outer membrane protein assembly factor BamA